MQFFKSLLVVLIILSKVQAFESSNLKDIIQTKEYGSCETNNLSFSSMKFYKIPLNEKYENYDLYLRILLFFNLDGSLSVRTTTQALLGCQADFCSYHPINDTWTKSHYSILESDKKIHVPNLGVIDYYNPSDINRGFELEFNSEYKYPHLAGQKFIGGMVSVNFNQDGVNTMNICRTP